MASQSVGVYAWRVAGVGLVVATLGIGIGVWSSTQAAPQTDSPVDAVLYGDSGTPGPIPRPAAPVISSVEPFDRAVRVRWVPPASTGGFEVSNYLVEATPGSSSCLVGADVSCTIAGLVNDVAYTFRVQALSAGGWSAFSDPSLPAVPKQEYGSPEVELPSEPEEPDEGEAEASIVITGSRVTLSGRPGIKVEGQTSRLVGEVVMPRFRFPGPGGYTDGLARRTVAERGHSRGSGEPGRRYTSSSKPSTAL